MANMTAQEAYRAVLQALTASNLINWVRGASAQLPVGLPIIC